MEYLIFTSLCILGLTGFAAIVQAIAWRVKDARKPVEPPQFGPSFVTPGLPIERASIEAQDEAERAASMWPPFNSAHEGFAILLEEVDELKEHVWMNQKKRDIPAMRKEAIQVAAMAIRFAVDVCDGERGRV